MTPIQYVPNDAIPKFGSVIGEAVSKEAGTITCVLHNVEESQWHTFNHHRWAVRPIAIQYQTDKQFFVLCRPVSMHKESASLIVARANPIASTLIPGPCHTMISIAEFKDLTADGCFNCGKPIPVATASSIEWHINETKPICVDCQVDFAKLSRHTDKHLS